MRNGVILIDKPPRMSSAGVVARVKRLLKADKVGHAGTLDPDATGLLVCLVGGATRVASYALEGQKLYSGIIQLGIRTNTDDVSGEVMSECQDVPSFDVVERAAESLKGVIQQLPPKVSAKKIDGRRAYALERQGHEVLLESREVKVERFDLAPLDAKRISYTVACSPGTYVRALARDLGEILGCGGAAETIRREGSGHLSVRDAVSLEEVSWERVSDWSTLIPHVPRISVPMRIAADLVQGRVSALDEVKDYCGVLPPESPIVIFAREGFEGESLGLLRVQGRGTLSFEATIARQDCFRGW